MGWDFGWKTKPELVAYASKGAIETKLVGKCLWVLVEYEGAPFIGLYLLEKHGGEWGYKALSECEGPYYYSCPLSFLKKAPERRPEWRKRVKEWHFEKAILRASNKLNKLAAA